MDVPVTWSFDTVLINLDSDADRLAHMGALLDDASMPFERMPAIFGLDMPAPLRAFFLDSDGGIASTLKRGEVGCYASHLMIHQRLAEQVEPRPLLVLEDDLHFGPDLGNLLEATLRLVPPGWDIIRLSNPPKRAFLPMARLPGGCELVVYSRIPNNTGAYLMSRTGAQKFLGFSGLRHRAVDEDMRRPCNCALVTYGIVQPPIRSNIFDSGIDAMGDRNLSTRRKLPKLFTGRTEGPVGGVRRLAWGIRALGMKSFMRCMWRNLVSGRIGGNWRIG